MFSQTYLPYIQAVGAVALGSDLKCKLVSAAVASVASLEFPFPTAPVESPEAHYEANVMAANSFIAGFNEASILDVKFAQELTRKLWLYRYYMVYPPVVHMPPRDKTNFAEAYTQWHRWVSDEEACPLNENLEVLWAIRDAVVTVRNLMKKECEGAGK